MEDLAEKMKIAKHIVSAYECEESTILALPVTEQFEAFTGWPLHGCIKEEKANFLQKYYEDKPITNIVDFVALRKKLVEWYVTESTLPTAKQIIDVVNEVAARRKIPKIKLFFERIAHVGFVWKQIPGTEKAIFVESSHRIAQRIGYLQKIRRLREAGKHFVYMNFNAVKKYKIAASSKLGLINYGSFRRPDFQSWLWEILGKVNEPSVFVYPQLWETEMIQPDVFVYPQAWRLKVTPFAGKKSLMTYLKVRGIPFDQKSHRVELYELAKRFSIVEDDEISTKFTALGHVCIARPHFKCTILSEQEPLDLFSQYASQISLKTNFTTKSDGTRLVDWKEVEEQLILRENVIYYEDLQMENAIDKLLTNGKNEGNAPDYLTDYSEVQKYDPEFGPANAFYE